MNTENQVTLFADEEIDALKQQVKQLENELNELNVEKAELEKLLSDFQRRYTIELGDILTEILKLRVEKFKDNQPKYEEAKKDYESYKEQVKTEREKPRFDLNDDEKKELKKKFRRATILCHPDKVAEENKKQAEQMFIELQKAYEANDLKKVAEIHENLEKGNFFKSASEGIDEKEKLKVEITRLELVLATLQSEISAIKDSETHKTIISIGDEWDKYFEKLQVKLSLELEDLRKSVI